MAGTRKQDPPSIVPDGAVVLLDCKFNRNSIAAVRGELSRCGASSGLNELALFNFVLAVNEITTNAVRYAGGHGQLQLWRYGNTLCCQVMDSGPGIPRWALDE